MPTAPAPDPMASVLERSGLLTRAQVLGLMCEQRALAARGRHVSLAKLAREFRYLSDAELSSVEALGQHLRAGHPLGAYLLAAGLVTPQDLADALAEQAPGGPRLGEILVQRERLTPTQLRMAMAMQRAADLGQVA